MSEEGKRPEKVVSKDLELKKLPREIEEIMEDLPENKRVEARQKLLSSTIIAHSSYSGPLPPPQVIKAYDKIIPNSAERILKMVENQSSHRIETEKIIIKEEIRQSARGQFFGLAVSLVALSASWHLAISGSETVAAIIGGTTVVGLVTVFVLGKKKNK